MAFQAVPCSGSIDPDHDPAHLYLFLCLLILPEFGEDSATISTFPDIVVLNGLLVTVSCLSFQRMASGRFDFKS